jgi:hypothetical protein
MDGDSEPGTENSLFQAVVQVAIAVAVAIAIATAIAIVMMVRYFIVH